jgi:hypothetical protein
MLARKRDKLNLTEKIFHALSKSTICNRSICSNTITVLHPSIQVHILQNSAESRSTSRRAAIFTQIRDEICFDLARIFNMENGFAVLDETGENAAFVHLYALLVD